MRLSQFSSYLSTLDDREITQQDVISFYNLFDDAMHYLSRISSNSNHEQENAQSEIGLAVRTYDFDENRSSAIAKIRYDDVSNRMYITYRSNLDREYSYHVNDGNEIELGLHDIVLRPYTSIGSTVAGWKRIGAISLVDT